MRSLKIRQSTIYYAGLLGRRSKRIVDQASDVPSIFFIISYRLRALKTLYFHFCNFIKKIEKLIERVFAKNFARFYEKKIILGTSDAWSTSCLSHRYSEPAYYIVDWWISTCGVAQYNSWANSFYIQFAQLGFVGSFFYRRTLLCKTEKYWNQIYLCLFIF